MARLPRATGFPLLLGSWLLAFAMMGTPVHASYGSIHAAVDFLTQAQSANPASDEQVKLLTSAQARLKRASTKNPAKAQALALVTAAIADAKSHNTAKLKEDISRALATTNSILPASSDATTPAAVAMRPEHTAPTVHLSEGQALALVLIKGDTAEGTGFLAKTLEGPVVVTNIHVISNNPNLKITTSSGAQVTILSLKGATDRDLAMIAVKDNSFSYLTLATDITKTVQPGDEVITPGNSEGGEVMLNTDGKVLGIGPDRVEFDNPIFHGNSGGPVFDVKTGQVIGVVSEAIKVANSDDLDKASFASRNSAISGSMRYFGVRLDNVPQWEPYNWNRFENETAFLDKFDLRSRCLDSYLNTPSATQATTEKKKNRKERQNGNDATSQEAAQLW